MSSVLKIWLSSSAVVKGHEGQYSHMEPLFFPPRNLMMVTWRPTVLMIKTNPD